MNVLELIKKGDRKIILMDTSIMATLRNNGKFGYDNEGEVELLRLAKLGKRMQWIDIDDLKFLKELANELRTQDTACTAKPVYYRIMVEDMDFGIDSDYADGMCIIGDEGEVFTNEHELIEWLISNYSISQADEIELRCLDDLEEIYDYCQDNKIVDSLTYTGYKKTEKFSEMFLTKRALKAHVEQNYYHYKKNPVSYAHHAWRNPEFKRLLDIVDKFADMPLPPNPKEEE